MSTDSLKIQRSVPEQTDSDFRDGLIRWCSGTAIIFCVTLFLCEIACRFFIFASKPALCSNPQWDDKYLVARTIGPGQDNVVLCGSSLTKQGLYPELITNRLHKINKNLRVTNLAANSGTQLDAIVYLEFLRCMRHTKPRLVVFDFEVSNLALPIAAINVRGDRADSYLFKARLTRPTEFFQSLGVAAEDCSLILRHRGNIKHLILEFLSTVANLKEFDRSSFYKLADVNDFGTSFAGMSPDHKLSSEEDWDEQRIRMSTSYRGSPKSGAFRLNLGVYSYIIKYCQQQNIPLMLVWLPHESVVYQTYWYSSPYTEDWFKQKFEEYSKERGVFPLYLNTLPQDCAMYSDYRHLSNLGCVHASELFAQALTNPKYRYLIETRK